MSSELSFDSGLNPARRGNEGEGNLEATEGISGSENKNKSERREGRVGQDRNIVIIEG